MHHDQVCTEWEDRTHDHEPTDNANQHTSSCQPACKPCSAETSTSNAYLWEGIQKISILGIQTTFIRVKFQILELLFLKSDDLELSIYLFDIDVWVKFININNVLIL